jgi:pimeloyl-ACP methyl ester carboxylesterase
MTAANNPTVVLVHGAFADTSSWSRVIAKLQNAGVTATAVANPLRSLTGDGEYVASAVAQLEGPVVLVGHSYGVPVITYASAKADNVVGLVFAGDDHAINPDSERAAAKRMGSTMVRIDGGSHAIALSQPTRVAAVILDAVAAVTKPH